MSKVKIKLSGDQVAVLNGLSERGRASDSMLRIACEVHQESALSLQAGMKDFWNGIAEEHGLEVQTTPYSIAQEGEDMFVVGVDMPEGDVFFPVEGAQGESVNTETVQETIQ